MDEIAEKRELDHLYSRLECPECNSSAVISFARLTPYCGYCNAYYNKDVRMKRSLCYVDDIVTEGCDIRKDFN